MNAQKVILQRDVDEKTLRFFTMFGRLHWKLCELNMYMQINGALKVHMPGADQLPDCRALVHSGLIQRC